MPFREMLGVEAKAIQSADDNFTLALMSRVALKV